MKPNNWEYWPHPDHPEIFEVVEFAENGKELPVATYVISESKARAIAAVPEMIELLSKAFLELNNAGIYGLRGELLTDEDVREIFETRDEIGTLMKRLEGESK